MRVTCTAGEADRRIIVAGGGYGGTSLVVALGKALARRPVEGLEVMLVEPSPCQQALSELDLVAVGPERPEFCELWLPAVLRDLPVNTCFNRIESVDTENRRVRIGNDDELDYWRLVICTGGVPRIPPIRGLKERAVTMWSVSDAQELQRRVNERLRHAARLPTHQQRRDALAFTVCGGGATGIEIVGTMGQLLPKRAVEIGLDASDLRIHLIEGRPDILYDLEPGQRAEARERLRRLGVEVFTGSMVAEVTDEFVILEDGRAVPTRVLCWAGGAKADPHASGWGFEADNAGRLITGADLKAAGHEDAYIVGDVASFRDPDTNHTLPMLAQVAISEGRHVAANLERELHGRQPLPFEPHMHGEFVSVGPSWGIGWALGLRLSGVPAILMKRLTYLMYWWQVGGMRLAWRRGRELLSMQR